LGLLKIHLLPCATAWRQPNSLPSLQIWKDEPSPRLNSANNGLVPSRAISTMTTGGITSLDPEIQCGMGGDDIVVYPTFKVTRVAGIKRKYQEDYDPTFSD